ncbi:MAG: hypothetical protein ACO3F5_07345 [Gemmatimonadaceae bacterium]
MPDHTLLAVWVALLGADRIDLLGDGGPVVLTPFLVLTPVVVLVALRARHRRDTEGQTLPPRALLHGALLLGLIALAAASLINSLDPITTGQRTILLAAQSLGASAVVWAVHDDPAGRSALARGARLGLALALLANLGQGAAFVGWLPSAVAAGDWRVIDVQAFNYAGVVPRFSGLALDPNRAALLALIHLAMLNADRRPATRGWIVLGLVLLALTLSRSGMLAAAVALLVRWGPAWTHRHERTHPRDDHGGRTVRTASDAPGPFTPSPRLTLALATATCVVVLGLLAAPTARGVIADRLAPAAERLSAAEGSARLHGELLRRGVDEATADVPHTLLGVGYGTSYLLLRDVFGTRYGNFHSLYVSTWVEMGIGALLIILALLVVPLRWATHWRPMVAALLVFNLFYQAGTEPGFWAMLALAWQDGTA